MMKAVIRQEDKAGGQQGTTDRILSKVPYCKIVKGRVVIHAKSERKDVQTRVILTLRVMSKGHELKCFT